MKILSKEFSKNGFTYKQVWREGNVAIYQQGRGNVMWERYEIGRIRQNQSRTVFGKVLEASESWPCSEEWGRLAYTEMDLRRAKERTLVLTPPKA